jgi:hypothetical protein
LLKWSLGDPLSNLCPSAPSLSKMAAITKKSKDHSTTVWLQLAQWFLRRRFICEFSKGSYVKLSSAVGAILIEGPKKWSLGDPLLKLCPSAPSCIQDGRHY